MVFPLLKLPILAYEQVILNLSIEDIVDFSLCSSRCHRIVRSIRFPLTGIRVNVSDYNSLRFLNGNEMVTQWTFSLGPVKRMKRNERRKIGGTEFRMKKTPWWQSNQTPAILLKVASDYVIDLFRVPITEYNLLVNDHQGLFPQLFGIRKCASMYLVRSAEIPDEELKYIVEKIEISKFLKANLKNNTNCGFVKFQMDELNIDSAFWITNDTFLAMDCARIKLTENRKLPIREFVFQWLSSRNTRFEWLCISAVSEKWDGFEGNPWNPSIRDRFYRAGYKKIDCSKGIDIVREDGLLATVLRRFGRNYFLVWHQRGPIAPNSSILNQKSWNSILDTSISKKVEPALKNISKIPTDRQLEEPEHLEILNQQNGVGFERRQEATREAGFWQMKR
uniref:F-box domain-containing protein n=1 Tax=Caenorhabditis tropicalis TaxID=1561998 RepID=A0A1I7UIM1_9PELO